MTSTKSGKIESLKGWLAAGSISPLLGGFSITGIVFGISAYFAPLLTAMVFIFLGFLGVWYAAVKVWECVIDEKFREWEE